jgi:hypothetical protein
MDKKTAREIADEWADVAARDPQDPYRLHEAHAGHDRARTAVMRQAQVTIPEGVVAAPVHDNRENPRVVAVKPDGRALYLVDFVPFDNDIDRNSVRETNVRVTATMIGLDSRSSRVAATTYWAQRYGVVVRVTRWRFELGAEELAFTTETAVEEGLPRDEAFAHALCSAIGCPVPHQATELERAA